MKHSLPNNIALIFYLFNSRKHCFNRISLFNFGESSIEHCKLRLETNISRKYITLAENSKATWANHPAIGVVRLETIKH